MTLCRTRQSIFSTGATFSYTAHFAATYSVFRCLGIPELLYSLEALITDISVKVAGSVAARVWNGLFLNLAYPKQYI